MTATVSSKKRLLLIFVSSALFTTIASFTLLPYFDANLFLVFFPAVMLPLNIIIYRTMNGELFSVLTFYSAIYLLECFGGAIKGSGGMVSGMRELDQLIEAIWVYFIAYLVFVAGYLAAFCWLMRGRLHMTARSGNVGFLPAYTLSSQGWRRLFILLLITCSFMFVQTYQRVQIAGSWEDYLANMYLYRFGTFTQDLAQNAFTVFANLVGGLSLSLAAIGLLVVLKADVSSGRKFLLYGFMVIIAFHAVLSTFRATLFFSILALVGMYDHVRPISVSTLAKISCILVGFLMSINFYHLYLYYSTAGWEYSGFLESMRYLIAPHGHLETLVSVMTTSVHYPPLGGDTLLESVFFFVPRFLWVDKADEYGTIIVQRWADLPVSYQLATTSVGELIAHFGLIGICGMLVHGAVHGFMETLRFRSLPLQAAFYCLVLPRLLAHLGMGISAVAISIIQLVMLHLLTKLIHFEKAPVVGGRIRATKMDSSQIGVKKRLGMHF